MPAGACPAAPRDIGERAKRYAILQHLLDVYRDPDDDKVHDVPIWENWLAQSGELPPDFEAMPTNAALPDMLAFAGGAPLTTAEQWPQRRAEMLEILQQYQLGRWPASPAWVAREISSHEDEELQCTHICVDLLLGPSRDAVTKLSYTGPASYQAAYMKVEVMIPHGGGPFPVLVGPDFRRYAGQRGSWVVPQPRPGRTIYEKAILRGYAVCTFDQNDTFACRQVFAGYDCTELVWWAWGICRCLDYLWTLDWVDKERIATAGHSRGGAVALLAACLDERVSATVASHLGAGLVVPLRYSAEKFGSQPLEVSTRLFPYVSYPRLRFFCGRENKLPFDAHFALGLVAPRPLLLACGYHDPVGELMGAHQSYQEARRVYALLGHEDRLNMVLDPGGHSLREPTMERWLAWLDLQFGRATSPVENEIRYSYTFERWRAATAQQVDVSHFPEGGLDMLAMESGQPITTAEQWHERRQDIAARMSWVMGALPERGKPPALRPERVEVYDENYRFRTDGGLVTDRLDLGGKLICYLTYDAGRAAAQGRRPVAIYCHAYCDQRGFAWERHESAGISVGELMAYAGFLAVQFDQVGYGRRNDEGGLDYFVARPHSSALGIMVQDVRRIIDALGELALADRERIAVIGYSLGGMVALHSAALDERIKAVVSVCGFGSMRLDAHGQATEGLGRYCLMRPTLPRLGFFIGHERRVPYDFHEVLAMIAPRRALIVAPRLDQDWLHEDVRHCYDAAHGVYRLLGAPQNVTLYAPDDFNRYPPKYQDVVNKWLRESIDSGQNMW